MINSKTLTQESGRYPLRIADIPEQDLVKFNSVSLGISYRRFLKGKQKSISGIRFQTQATADDKNTTDALPLQPALQVGSPVMIIEEPPFVKTAEPMPMLKPNQGIITVGDAGRILDKRPKDVWAIKFAKGAFLVDRKYFKPLEVK